MVVSHTSGFHILRLAFSGRTLTRACSEGDKSLWPSPISHDHLLITRRYAALGKLEGSPKSSIPSRKAVTFVNDDGRVPWNDLSTKEKTARTAQQTFNFGIVLAGAMGTVGQLSPPSRLVHS